jgi:glycerol-3-phosphate dehydrogenase
MKANVNEQAAPEPSVTCDVLVVGGGINGAGIARDLAGRGLKVVLCEKDDLAAHTSSASTKLIHGGLRYLEHLEFALVRKALAEREVLMRSAPHIMRPLRFVMPHDAQAPGTRPVWMIRLGLFLYDHLARREWLPGSSTVDLHAHPAGAPLQRRFAHGFVYSDGWVDDARLVVLNAVDAAQRGAQIHTRCRCVRAEREAAGWTATLQHADGRVQRVQARALVNAAGPWAGQFLREQARIAQAKTLRLVKGSHIVVKKLFAHDHAYIFQNPDKRIIFAIPYEGDYTLIGTTDVEHQGPIGAPRIEAAEVRYLCEQASRYFEKPVLPADVVWSYSGVRPLLDDDTGDPSAVTRDYQLELDTQAAPLLSVWGGKITTFRRLAEEAADLLARPLGERRPPWTERAPLPGGDLRDWIGAPQRPDVDLQRLRRVLQARHPELDEDTVNRWSRQYGSRVSLVLASPGLGTRIVPGVHEAELRYLHQHEWARAIDDVLWRRTKLGLHLAAAEQALLAAWWQREFGEPGNIASSEAPTPMENAWS